ncbi:M56 family metallopeptidase [Maribacter sp. ACAM166]|uniref:M56 family metallopeptidase n=1 Tax=Maribacter sp. ACAM166 TaxID=2508996 RepID=UPI0010FF208C|nr:M56 family metallopeptidase [Maribacter sp. ACAM166]TLP80473.1 hypothetical protein ES765_08390 [Maribacter sp. ACAM166]
MEVTCYYLLKSSFLLFLFFGCYQLFLRKETLFYFNRLFLLGGLVLSATLPLLYSTKTIAIPVVQLQQTTQAATTITNEGVNMLMTPYALYIILYTIGAIILFIKLFKQGAQLKRVINKGQRLKLHANVHIQTKDKIQPFSFFNTIVYNPQNHTKNELVAILAHEEVHASQLHSFDILLMEVFLALQWFNPIVWLYRIAIKQNLEFLADTENHQIKRNKKAYHYVLLRQAVRNHHISIVNPFFNSFIKKRIVMINQHQSHKSKALKSLILVPLLAFFLLSFNVKKVYRVTTTEQSIDTATTIELLIDKNTTDQQLLKIKTDLVKENFDFSYTTVRNKAGELKNISLHIAGGTKKSGEVSSRFNSASDNDTIDPTYILIDTAKNSISIATAEVSNERSKIRKVTSSNNKQVVISTSPFEEHDIQILEEEGSGFMFVDYDGEQEPLIYVDGKISDSKTIKKIDPNLIASLHVLKGEAALKKYGEKAKYGVVEITTKN